MDPRTGILMGEIALRPYQEEARRKVEDTWIAGTRRTLLVLPTGCGKTIVFAKITEDMVRKGKRVLILALMVQGDSRVRAVPAAGETA